MSLTSFLKDREVAERFKREFEKPRLGSKAPLAAPPLTRSYTLTGIAFDYVLRFYLQKVNPNAIAQKWVAEDALDLLRVYTGPQFVVDGVSDVGSALKKAERIVARAKASLQKYLAERGRGKPGEELIRASVGLSQLDPFCRAGVIDEGQLGKINKPIIQDLRNLLSLVESRRFAARRVCALNPSFGRASRLVGGADADLVIDGTLIDVKTTKFLRLDRATFNQLVGYYLLHRIGGIDGCRKNHRIEKLGVYYSRYGVLFSFPARQVVQDKRLPSLLRWFAKKAREPEVCYVRLSGA